MSDNKGNNKDNIKYRIKGHVSGALRALLVAILVVLQFIFIFSVSAMLNRDSIYYYLIIEIFSFIVILCLVNDDRSPSYKIAWISIVLILPVSGHLMYVLWGNEASSKKITNQIMDKIIKGNKYAVQDTYTVDAFEKQYPGIQRMSSYLRNESFPLYKNNEIDYYSMGENVFEAMIGDFYRAKEYILLNFFIVSEGELWERIHSVLKQKLNEGVKVYFLYDDFGAMFSTNKYFEEDLVNEGFEVRVFNPIHKYLDKLYMNYRSHQKIVVIDGTVGYTGGINLADEYANIKQRFGVWKDTAVRIHGDAVRGLIITFLQMWTVTGNDDIDYSKFFRDNNIDNNNFCHIISDGPANNPENPIENIYNQMIYYAGKYCYITTPYLIIEDDMKTALETAVRSGVDVRIITPKIPDKKSIKKLTNYNYGRLLKNGVKIYEYSKGFIHAKMIVNENSAIVGTINMDYRSFYLHYECGAFMCAKQTVKDVTEDILDTIDDCEEITYEQWRKRPLYLKLYQWFFNLFQTLA